MSSEETGATRPGIRGRCSQARRGHCQHNTEAMKVLKSVSISVFGIGLFIFSISSWFSLGRLYLSKNLFIYSRLPILLVYSFL